MYGRHRNGLGIDPATGTGTVIGSDGKEYEIGPGADLTGAILWGANLTGANLTGAILRKAKLGEAILEGADLTGAKLEWADLTLADLENTILEGANLTGAWMAAANLGEANLRNSSLHGADLHGAFLKGADLTGANLNGASFGFATVDPEHIQLIENEHRQMMSTLNSFHSNVTPVPRPRKVISPGRIPNPGYGLYDASYQEGDRPPKIVGSSDPYVLDAALSNHHGPTSTVEAEYGDAVVSGSWATLAHHGSRSHNLCPCLEENRQPPPDLLIGVSHFDLDTLGGTMALLGIKPNAPDFWRVAARIDTEGPHKLPLMGATRDTVDCLNAFWAWSEDNRVNLPRASAQGPAPLVDLTDLFLKASSFITALLAGHRADAVSAGRAWVARNEALERETLVSEYGNGAVLLRSSDRFVNHLYGPTAVAVVGYNTAKGSISLSFSDEGLRRGLSANDILQEVYGPLAGGHVGIGGTPRGETYTLDDAAAFAQIVADKLLRRTPNPGYGRRR